MRQPQPLLLFYISYHYSPSAPMSQVGGPTLKVALPKAAVESTSFDDFIQAIETSNQSMCIITKGVTEEKLRARLALNSYADNNEWVHSHAAWPTGEKLSISTIAAGLYDFRGCRFIDEIQIDGIALMARDDITPQWRVGDLVPGGYLLDCVQLDDTHVLARIHVHAQPPLFRVSVHS